MHKLIKATVVATIIALTAAACTSLEEAGEEAQAEEQERESADVELTNCGTDSFGAGTLAAQLAITNSSSKRSNYSIEVTFESPDGATSYGSGLEFVENVKPGQKTTGEALSTDQAPADEFTCRIVSVDRTSDVG